MSGLQTDVVQGQTPAGRPGPIVRLRSTTEDGVAAVSLGGWVVPDGDIVFSVYAPRFSVPSLGDGISKHLPLGLKQSRTSSRLLLDIDTIKAVQKRAIRVYF
jgi:hypothetical protein